MAHKNAAWVAAALLAGAPASYACSTSNESTTASATEDAGKVVLPPKAYAIANPITPPPGTSSIDTLAVDESTGVLYASAGATILRVDAAAGGAFSVWMDLSSFGISSLTTMRVLDGGDIAGASSGMIVRIKTAGRSVVLAQPFTLPFHGGGLGGAGSFAVSPDGSTLYAVEGGSGSGGANGQSVVHAARFSIPSQATFADAGLPTDGGADDGGTPDGGASDAGVAGPVVVPLEAAEVWELVDPFKVVPSTTSVLNASAPFVSKDGSILYVAHVVLRTLYAVELTGAHKVTAVDTDSLQRSAGSFSLDSTGLLVEAANFDQTIAVFELSEGLKAKLVIEVPTGGSPGAVASYKSRVFVAQGGGGGFGGLPPGGDGGFPGFGDGGLPPTGDGGGGAPGNGGFGPPQAGDGGSASPTIQVYELKDVK
jgi:sugar lactone lactonase YvrE